MRRLLCLGGLVCLVIALAWRFGAMPFFFVPLSTPNPGDGRVASGVYTNAYFDLALPLPAGWTEGEAGPPPSQSGYYVLGTLVPKGEFNGTILVAAQDMFFAPKSLADATAMTQDFRDNMAAVDGMTIDREISELTIAGRLVHRVDFSGVGLHRAMLAADIRCHVVSFHLTTRNEQQLDKLAESLNKLSFAGGKSARAAPLCIKDYAVADNVLRRVEPTMAGPAVGPIPVRIVIGTDGGVRHVHVIRASDEQRKAIERCTAAMALQAPSGERTRGRGRDRLVVCSDARAAVTAASALIVKRPLRLRGTIRTCSVISPQNADTGGRRATSLPVSRAGIPRPLPGHLTKSTACPSTLRRDRATRAQSGNPQGGDLAG